jgi:hypothetical protein
MHPIEARYCLILWDFVMNGLRRGLSLAGSIAVAVLSGNVGQLKPH